MSAHIIDGKAIAKKLLQELALAIKSSGQTPVIATVLVGEDPASSIYVANKRKRALEVGIKSIHHHLEANTREKDLLKLINDLNNDEIDGILVQLPLPKHIDENKIIDAIDPKKDVDGFHPMNLGYLMRGDAKTVACTPQGIMEIFRQENYSLLGKHAVVIGRSNIVGKPVAALLLAESATVTICHSKTSNLSAITKEADVVIAAIGKAKFINKSHIKEGAFVVDVGINRENNQVCGDVDFEDVLETAGFLTPVPGGVGPLTIAMLLKNTFTNFLRTRGADA